MPKLEPLQLDILTSSDGKGLTEAEQGVFNFSKNAIANSQKIVTAYAAVGGAFVAAAGFGLKLAGETEALRANMDVMTGSVEKGKQLFVDLTKFANATPFETTSLAKATQTMLGFGIESKDVMSNLQMLGDVSMGNKDKLQSLALAYSQVQSTGRLMGNDLLQMINAGFNPLNVISQATGKSMTELKDTMAAGGISAEMVADSFKLATGEGGLFYKGMERGAQTLPGQLSTLSDGFATVVRAVVGLNDAGEVVSGGLMEGVKNFISTLNEGIASNMPNILEKISQFTKFLTDNKETMLIVASAIAGPLVASLVVLAGAAWTALAPILLWAAPFIAIGAAIGLLLPYFPMLWETVRPVVENISNSFMNFINTHIPAFQAFWDVVKGIFTFALGFIESFIKTTWNGIAQFFKGIWEIIAGIFKVGLGLIEIIFGIFQGIFTGDWERAWKTIEVGFKDIFGGLKSFFKGILDSLIGYLKTFVNGFIGIINGMIGGINKVSIGIGGKGAVQIPEIPHLATGTNNFKGGIALVGEQGPELVSLPRGSQVTPNSQTEQILSSQQRPIEVIQYIQTPVDLDFMFSELAYVFKSA